MAKMTMDQFKDYLEKNLGDYLAKGNTKLEVRVVDVLSENDVVTTRIMLMDTEMQTKILIDGDVNQYFDEYVHRQMIEPEPEKAILQKLEVECNQIMEWNMDRFEKVDRMFILENVMPVLVGREMNQTMLQGVPWRKFLDLAVIYYVDVGNDYHIKMTNKIMDILNFTEETLYAAAVKNLAENPAVIKSLFDQISEFLGSEPFSELEDGINNKIENTMYVITNNALWRGASYMLNPETLQQVCRKMGTDEIYILPSSIHEFLAIHKYDGEGKELDVWELQVMVQEINENQVAPKERLSNQIYSYDIRTQKVTLATAKTLQKAEQRTGISKLKENIL